MLLIFHFILGWLTIGQYIHLFLLSLWHLPLLTYLLTIPPSIDPLLALYNISQIQDQISLFLWIDYAKPSTLYNNLMLSSWNMFYATLKVHFPMTSSFHHHIYTNCILGCWLGRQPLRSSAIHNWFLLILGRCSYLLESLKMENYFSLFYWGRISCLGCYSNWYYLGSMLTTGFQNIITFSYNPLLWQPIGHHLDQ